MKNLLFPILIIFTACTSPKQEQEPSINELADSYLDRYLSTYPESSYFVDIEIEDHSGFSSNKLDDIKKWEDFEDSLYIKIQKIDQSKIQNQSEKISYWLLKEELESSIDMRVCKRELWNVSHMWGFYHLWSQIADYQPIGNDSLRKQAFKRWGKFPQYVEAEIVKLNTGIAQGYTMPKEIVEIVIGQVQTLADYDLEDSPFMSPARRDSAENFQKEWSNLVREQINPALSKYSEYLQNQYLEKARTKVSVLSLPNGNECYQAFVRSRTTTKKTGQEIFEKGLAIVNANIEVIEELGNRLYQLDSFEEIISGIAKDSSLYFTSSDEILSFNEAIIDSAKSKCVDWFDLMPSTEVSIKPYLKYESGFGSYESATKNKPAYFRINLKNPEEQTYHENEKLSFHEAYPGHHLQIGIEKDIKGLHPIRKLIGFGSYSEGWARYSEQLAEEMGLYNFQASLIHRRAWPSRGMVVDPALHIKDWPKDSLVNFMMASGMNHAKAISGYQRSIVYPAQLTSYDVGCEEIKALRKLAEDKLADSFSIKEFHTKILENGSIPLSALRNVIELWIEDKLTTIE
jgi:uncharacterized protein (DUF885 family)